MAPTFTEREERYLRELATRYYIRLDKLTPIVYTSVSDSGVMLTIRYLTQVQRRRNMEREIWEAVLHAFAREDDIDFAYNTQRVFYNPREGKPGAGGPKPRGER
jgi:small-conductance mechanosensitive channel